MRLSTLRTLAVRLLLAALVVGAAVGLQGAGPGAADSTGWRADVLVDRLETIGIVVVAVLLLPSVVLVLWTRGEGPPQRRRTRPRTVVVLIAFALTLAAALLIADRYHPDRRPAAAQEVVQEDPAPVPEARQRHDGPPWPVLSLLAVVTVGAAVLNGRRRRTEDELVALPAVQEPTTTTAWQDGARAAVDALRSRPQDPPRARVLSAYEAFEAALAAQGVVRGTAGTATGLLDRAVAEGFPAADALRLTELFNLARYAEQPVTDADVAAAERALSSVLAAS